MNIFEMLHERYTLPKKVRLFEAFSGIGCQRMGFEKANIDYEVVGISEIDKYALKSYEAMHGHCPNLGSITDIKGSELPNIDVFTWSFPCTDLSKAGKQKGLDGTRSGLVYEVLRILHEAHEADNLPKVLIMENVVDLVQTKFIREFQEIQRELELLGYSNYTETLNAKDYGVAQNRDRVFMVSILGDYYYEFPKPIKLEKRLKDYLEDEVDEKYYLSDKLLNFFEENSVRNEVNGNGFRFTPKATMEYESLVGWTYLANKGKKHTGALRLTVLAYFKIPKSRTDLKRGDWHLNNVDIDNIVKCISDGLNGLAFEDDKQIAQIFASKYWDDNERVEVEIEEIENG